MEKDLDWPDNQVGGIHVAANCGAITLNGNLVVV